MYDSPESKGSASQSLPICQEGGISDAFKHTQPFVDAVFPKDKTPLGHAQGRDRLLEREHRDPTVPFVKPAATITEQYVASPTVRSLEEVPVDEQLKGGF